ncbi:MAG TPA: hypothetical protein VK862_21260 [Afifellaceae bacterium]|nr:hypothetical protein [Afifellaceae bacterium]
MRADTCGSLAQHAEGKDNMLDRTDADRICVAYRFAPVKGEQEKLA